MVGLHRAILGRDGRALDQGQQVALHPFARDVGAAAAILTRGDLVDLVQEDDAFVLGQQQGLLGQAFLIQQLVALFGDKGRQGVTHGQLDRLGAAAAHLAQHLRQVQQADIAGAAWHIQPLQRRGRVRQSDLDLLVVQFPGAQFLAEGLARRRLRARSDQGVQDAFLGLTFGASLDARAALVAHHDQGAFDQIAHDLIDVAADIADLGELGGLDLEEGRTGKPRQTPGDLGLAHARRADHQDVLGRDLVAQIVRHALAAPAVTQGHGDGALGVVLTDDEAVQFRNDFAGRQISHGSDGPEIRLSGAQAASRRAATIAPYKLSMVRLPLV